MPPPRPGRTNELEATAEWRIRDAFARFPASVGLDRVKPAMAKTKTVVTIISKISDRPAGRHAALVVIYGLDLGRKYDLDKPTIVIGRSSKSDIQIDQESISRSHAIWGSSLSAVSRADNAPAGSVRPVSR